MKHQTNDLLEVFYRFYKDRTYCPRTQTLEGIILGQFGEKCGSRQSASWHLPGLPIPGPLSQVQDPGYQCNAGPGQGLVVGGTMMGTWALVTHPEWITANTSKYLTWSMGPVFPFRAPHGNRSQTSSLFHTIRSWRNEEHSPVFKLKHFPQ